MKNFFSSNRLVFQNAGGPGEAPKGPEGQKPQLPVEQPKPADWKKKGEDLTKKEGAKLSASEEVEKNKQDWHQKIREWFQNEPEKFNDPENRSALIGFLKTENPGQQKIDYRVGPQIENGNVVLGGVRLLYNSTTDQLDVKPYTLQPNVSPR